MVKILHVIRSLGSGGAERQIVDLIKHTSGLGFSHSVCYFTQPDLFAEEITKAGGKLVCLNIHNNRAWFKTAKHLRDVIRDFKPHVIHSWLLDATMATRIACFDNRDLPRIISLCGPDYEPDAISGAGWPNWKMQLLRLIDSRSGWCFNEHFVACSDYVRESGRVRLGISKNRIVTIYNSVDPESLAVAGESSDAFRRSFGISDNAVVFINVGRLDPQKGQEYLIHAFKHIEVQAPNAYVLLVGEGGRESKLKTLVSELNLSHKVRFLGVRNDVGRCLRSSDIFVFPSVFEGFGMALIEAMFLAIPTISFRVGPIPEIIENSEVGKLVSPHNVDELAAAMLSMYRAPELRRRIGEQGQKSALRRFSSQRSIMKQWQKTYLELVPFARTAGD